MPRAVIEPRESIVRVLVTGASGFIGGHVIRALQQIQGIEVMATGRSEERLRQLDVPFAAVDLHDSPTGLHTKFLEPEVLIHLAWPDLSSYHDPVHIEQHLWDSYRFVVDMAEAGVKRISCIGSCYEYGLQEGCLAEDQPTAPVTAYGVAKDSLRRMLEYRLASMSTDLRWLRPFYTHGQGQQSRALLPQLDRAIDADQATFPMSGGEQVRDYLEVSELAQAIAKTTLQSEVSGIINICSGQPTSVRSLVEEHIKARGSSIRPEFGHFPYPSHAPMEFWGDTKRLEKALSAYDRCVEESELAMPDT
jgi:dTDP-6-deoxy-L-talose 4-dehydrogenase (NAD+)